MALEKTWRWFGPKDAITLADLQQIGIEGIVTALHHLQPGEVWTVEEIQKTRDNIEAHGMRWSVVESLPVSEGIKMNNAQRDQLVENYKQSLRNLGACGIDTVCYNFMPVLDWARTKLNYKMPNGSESLYFDFLDFAAFDIYMLERPNAAADYSDEMIQKAKARYESLSQAQIDEVVYNITIATQSFVNGVVGEDEKDPKAVFRALLAQYGEIDREQLRANLKAFLDDIVPVAEEAGINLCIHPDDPPYAVLGLPRIMCNADDYKWLTEANTSINNGFTFCVGSLSAGPSNNLVDMINQYGERIHFIHLRNTQRDEFGNFYESGHLKGSVDMFEVVKALLTEQHKRMESGRTDLRMPFRPDHGVRIADDFRQKHNPGYPLLGRLRGLAEMDGLAAGIERAFFKK
ncbi:MAG: hypothetical protein RIS47_244 [Bacteroidota bacterium]